MELLRAMRLFADEGRVRIFRLLAQEELSVAELQEILGMGQSRISMQLSQLRSGGLIALRRVGQKSLYCTAAPPSDQPILDEVIRRSAAEIALAARDDLGLSLVMERRSDRLRTYFDELAGRFGRNYLPGRSWKALSELLLRFMPPMDIADLGAGEGTLALLFAQRARMVVAVDSSERMVSYGRGVAERSGIENIDYRLGNMEDLPIESASIDLALMHQVLHHAVHPARAMSEALRILRPGGKVVIFDLLAHAVEAARELYADLWLGFSLADLHELLSAAGFTDVVAGAVDREAEPPYFQTVLATGAKPFH